MLSIVTNRTGSKIVRFARYQAVLNVGYQAVLKGVLKGTFQAVLKALWRTKKSHFRPSDEMSMKTVDKDAVNTKISLICYPNSLNFVK